MALCMACCVSGQVSRASLIVPAPCPFVQPWMCPSVDTSSCLDPGNGLLHAPLSALRGRAYSCRSLMFNDHGTAEICIPAPARTSDGLVVEITTGTYESGLQWMHGRSSGHCPEEGWPAAGFSCRHCVLAHPGTLWWGEGGRLRSCGVQRSVKLWPVHFPIIYIVEGGGGNKC
jgi:hypothetical protein